jgi:predicted amidophosphoribosyltransferase
MARINVTVPDELLQHVRELDRVVFSKVLQDGLRALLACDHRQLACTRCGQRLARQMAGAEAVERFYREAMWALDDLVHDGGTAEGAARVLKRVGVDNGVAAADAMALPRPTRAEREMRRRVRDFPNERSNTA